MRPFDRFADASSSPTRSTRSWAWFTWLGSAALLGCSGGGNLQDAAPDGQDVEFAVLSTSVGNGDTWKLNRPIFVEFTEDVDFSTVSSSTIQIIDAQGVSAIGSFSLVNPRTVRFQPNCPTNNTNSDGGFLQGRDYRLTISSFTHSGVGGGVTLRNTAGEGIRSGRNVQFSTPASLDSTVLFVDVVAGPPQVRILGVDEDAPASTTDAIHSYVEFGEDPENVEYFRFDPSDQRGEIASLVPLNLYSDVSERFAVVLNFNQPVLGTDANVNSDLIRLEYFNESVAEWLRVTSSVELQQNCSTGGATVRLQPTGIVPQGAALRVSLRAGFRDLIGEQVQATQSRFAHLSSTAANPAAPAGQEGEGSDEILERFALTGDAAGSLEDTAVSSPLPRANWGNSNSPGALSASFNFDGTGGLGGDFDVTIRAGDALTIMTDFDSISGGPGASTSSNQPVINGRLDVRNLTIEPGGRLVFIGPNTASILATGEVRIDGLISVNGGGNFGVSTLATTNFPEEGANGQAGGGDGGTASSFTTQSTPRGSRGDGAFGAVAMGGQGGESAFAPTGPCETERRRAAGGGGGRLGADVRYDVDGTFAQPLALCQMLVGMDAEPGFPGSFNGTGAVSQVASALGGEIAPGPFTDAQDDNNFFGTLIKPSGEQVRGELTSLWAGSGGGGGGDAVTSSTFPLTPFTVSGDEKGCGGGGGAGGLLILAIGDIIIAPNGSVTADGGHGGGGENNFLRDRIGGGSGGGSGGHIVMSSAGSIIIQAEATSDSTGDFYRDSIEITRHTMRPLRALGGQGGVGRRDRCGASGEGPVGWRADGIPAEAFEGRTDIPPNVDPLPNTFDWCNRLPSGNDCSDLIPGPEGTAFGGGGDGGPGIIQLHVSDPDTQLVFGAAGLTGYETAGIDVTRSMVPPPLGWSTPTERPDVLVPFFSSRSESFSRWIPLGLARQNPDGTSNQLEFVFEGTDDDASVTRTGGLARELEPIVPYTGLSIAGSTPSVDPVTGVVRVSSVDLLDPNGLYSRNAMLLREYVVRIRSSEAPSGAVEYSVIAATLDTENDEYVMSLDPRGASLATDLAELSFGDGELQFEVVPFYFRLVTEGTLDALPEGTNVKILFDATIEDPLTGQPSAAAEASYSARVDADAMDLDVKNGFATVIDALNGQVAQPGQTDPNNVILETVNWDFVRFKVEFNIAAGLETPNLTTPRPGLDFLRLPYRF